MGCWAITNRHGMLAFAFRYRGRQWQKSTGERFDEPKARARGEAMAAWITDLMADGRFEAEYGRIFEGDARFTPAVRPADVGLTPLLREWTPKIIAEYQPPLHRPEYGRTATSHVDAWITPQLGHRRLAEITRDDVIALRTAIMQHGKAGKGATQKHAKNVIGTLRVLLREAFERGVISSNPATGLRWPRARRHAIDPLTREELETVLEHLRKKSAHAYRYALCLADTGLRPGEASALTWGDVDLRSEGMIAVRQSKVKGRIGATKTAHSERTLRPLSARLRAVLLDSKPLHVKPETPVFSGPTGRPIRQERFQGRRWVKALRATNVRPRTLYKLRSTFISLALSAGENQQWLAEYTGTSLTMFARHYARFFTTARARAAGAYSGPAGRERYTQGERCSASCQKTQESLRVSDGSRTHNPRSHSPVLYR